jgi:hypothetical protein
MLVPVNFAAIWSYPRAEISFSGQSMYHAETGGWCEVCSVRYDILTLFLPGCCVVDDLLDAIEAALLAGALDGCLSCGRVSSTTQLH